MRTLLAALVLAAALAAAASAATPAQWKGQANSICAKANRDLNAIPEPKGRLQLITGLTKVHDRIAGELRALGALEKPSSMAAGIDRMLHFAAQGNGYLGAAVVRLRKRQAYQPMLAKSTPSFEQANRLARQLGATECAKS